MNKKIQILRAMAILAVVMIHTNTGGYIGVAIRPFVNFAVAMFIFLSGYLTKLNIVDLKKFYIKRISRVLVPYCIWSAIYTIVYGNYSEFIKNFFTAQCCGIYYFIFVYVQLVLISPMVGKLIQSKYRWIGWCITPVSIIIIRYVMNLLNIPVGFPWNGIAFVVWFIYFYIGMLLGNHVLEYKLTVKKTLLLYIATLVLSEGEGLVWYLIGNNDMATTQLRFTSILTSIMVILLSYLFIRSDRIKVKDNKLTLNCNSKLN